MVAGVYSSAWLEGATGQRTPVGSSCFLGRSASCEVVLADAKVSRQHALIQAQNDNEFWLVDLGSANGTYLNGQRVRNACRLADGDAISIAGLTFGFHCASAAARLVAEPTTDATLQEIRSEICWLLVADIQGSTVLLRGLPVEEAPRLTGRWLAACRQILDQHRGIMNKVLGDGFLAYWPAVATPCKRVTDALSDLKQLQERAEPPFRLVLHYGQVSLCSLASPGEEGLSGNEVHFAFRMEKLAGSLGIARLLSEPARLHLAGLVSPSQQQRHVVPGFDGDHLFFAF